MTTFQMRPETLALTQKCKEHCTALHELLVKFSNDLPDDASIVPAQLMLEVQKARAAARRTLTHVQRMEQESEEPYLSNPL